MAKKFTAKDQQALNAQAKEYGKILQANQAKVDTMSQKYDSFADKRKKEAKDYLKSLQAAEKALDTINNNYSEILDNLQSAQDAAKEQANYQREIEQAGHSLTKIMGDFAKQQEESILNAAALSDYSVTETQAKLAQAALDKGRLAVGQSISALISLDAQMLTDVVDSNIDIGSLMESQDQILTEMAQTHQDEISALEQLNASEEEILAKKIEQKTEEDEILTFMEAQVDKAQELNDKLSEKNALGIEYRKILGQQQERLNEQQKAMNDLKDKISDYVGMFSNPQLLIFTAGKWLLDQIGLAREFANEMGTGMGFATEMTAQSKLIALEFAGMGIKAEDVVNAQKAMLNQSFQLSEVNRENVKNVTLLADRFGLGSETAAKFVKNLNEMEESTGTTAEEAAQFLKGMAEVNNLAPGQLMAVVADNTEQFSRFGKRGFEEMTKAAIATKKLNVEFSSLLSAGKGMLDVESSLQAEMEASVLIGRELNLNAARQAYNSGNMLEFTKEITKQAGSLADFQDMSVIKQDSLAAALGMTTEELVNILENQGKINDITDEGADAVKKISEEQSLQDPWYMRTLSFLGEHATMAATVASSFGGWSKMLGPVGGLLGGIGKKIGGMIPGLNKLTGAGAGPLTKAGKPDMRFKVNKEKFGGAAKPDLPKAKAPTMPDTKGGGPGAKGGVMDNIGKMDMKKAMQGAAAMILVAAAVFVFAKAVQEFMKVSWEAVGMAVVSMLALVGAVALLGAIMMSGVGAAAIIAGAAAMLIVASAMYVLAHALKVVSEAIPNFLLLIPMLPQLAMGMMMMYPAIPAMFLMAPALIAMGLALGAASVGFLLFTAAGGAESLLAMSEALAPLAELGEGLLMGGAGIAALGVGIIPLAIGMLLLGPMVPMFMMFATAITMMIEPLTILATLLEPLTGMGMVLAQLGMGFAALGVGFIPMAVGLALITPLLPTLFALEKLGLLGSIKTAEADLEAAENEEESEGGGGRGSAMGNAMMMAKLDELISAVKSGGTINLDGRKVGEVLHLGKGPVGA
jgi:hypothetical protein